MNIPGNGPKSRGAMVYAMARRRQMPLELASKTRSRHPVVLDCEDPAEFQALWDGYITTYRPRGVTQSFCVETMAAADWRLRRAQRIETALPGIARPARGKADNSRTLATLSKYRPQLQRT